MFELTPVTLIIAAVIFAAIIGIFYVTIRKELK